MRNLATWLTVVLATALVGGLLSASAASAVESVPGSVMADGPVERGAQSGGTAEAGPSGGSEPAGSEFCGSSPEADDTDREFNLGRSSAASRLAFGGRVCLLHQLTDILFVEDAFDPD